MPRSTVPLRVLVSAYACRPNSGSEPGIGWNWAVELARAGAHVWVLTRADNREFIESAATEAELPNLKFTYVEHSGIASLLSRVALGQNWNHIQWPVRAYRAARELDARVNFNLVHHVSYGSLQIGSLLWRLKKPFVFGPAGGAQVAPGGYRPHFKGGWFAEQARTFVARYLSPYVLRARSTVRGASLVLVVNNETEALVRKLKPQRVAFMPDVGIPASQIATHSKVSTAPDAPLRILWVGRLLPRKGLLLALEAMAGLSNLDWRLTIIGGGPQSAFLPMWLETLGLQKRVDYRGQLPWDEVQRAYDDADLFLFTSLRDSNGFQMVEAMSRGVPVLALDHHGGSVLVPPDAGILVPVGAARETAEALSRSIQAMARDRHRLRSMGEAAIEHAKKHTWPSKAAEVMALYTDLLPPE